MAPRLTILDWDSAHFGVRIARLEAEPLVAADAHLVVEWCNQNSVDCLYYLSSFSDSETASQAARIGLRPVDVRVTLARELAALARDPAPLDGGLALRRAEAGDLSALEALAADSHGDTRFWFDRRFARDRVEELYRTWIRRAVAEDAVFVVARESALGYLSCRVLDGGEGEIGLVALAPSVRGQGAGAALIAAGLRWLDERGASGVRVVTQGRNLRAQRLYQRAGFVTRAVELWYHRWSDDP
jgi:dTDP-4-amino-4,6-dideoxy-D-galactose acyltransferase